MRIRVFDTLHGSASIDELGDKIIRECGWQLADGHRLSNLLFIPFAVDKGYIKIATGSAINARISEAAATKAIVSLMAPQWSGYKKDPNALTTGLVTMLDSFKVELARPLSGGGNTTIVNNQASDTSWLKWFVIGVIGLAAGAFVIVIIIRSKQDGGNDKAAQQKARGVCADCVSRIQTISNPKFVSERQFAINAIDGSVPASTTQALLANLEKVKDYASSARSALSRFLPDQEKDPNPNGLSSAAYANNEQACTDMIVHFVEPAEELARKIDKETSQASATSKVS